MRGLRAHGGLYKREREDTFDAEGWYHTGDRGYVEDGAVFFLGRYSEMIKSAGANVAPLEVETVLLSFPEVARGVRRRTPHPNRGEEVVAVVVATSGVEIDTDDLRARASTSCRRTRCRPVTSCSRRRRAAPRHRQGGQAIHGVARGRGVIVMVPVPPTTDLTGGS